MFRSKGKVGGLGFLKTSDPLFYTFSAFGFSIITGNKAESKSS